MDQRTSPTRRRRSCRQYWNNLPDHRKTEILSRREWTTSTSLINLPPTRRCGRRHHLSGKEGDNEADDANVGEDSISNHTDNVNDANEEDDSDHNDDDEENEYYYDDFNGDILFYDSDNHSIIEDFHPSDEVDKEDEEDEDNEDSDIDIDNEDEDKEEDEYKDKDQDEDEDKEEDEDEEEDKEEDEDEDEEEDEDEDED